jgi:hypothetical protein
MSDSVPNLTRASALNIVIASDTAAKPFACLNLQPLPYQALKSLNCGGVRFPHGGKHGAAGNEIVLRGFARKTSGRETAGPRGDYKVEGRLRF